MRVHEPVRDRFDFHARSLLTLQYLSYLRHFAPWFHVRYTAYKVPGTCYLVPNMTLYWNNHRCNGFWMSVSIRCLLYSSTSTKYLASRLRFCDYAITIWHEECMCENHLDSAVSMVEVVTISSTRYWNITSFLASMVSSMIYLVFCVIREPLTLSTLTSL